MSATASPRTEPATEEAVDTARETRHAPQWKVLFHNDDHTPQDFVTAVLMRFFGHDHAAALRIMLTVHRKGLGLAGIYPLELAELKQQQTLSAARPRYPLRVTLEPA